MAKNKYIEKNNKKNHRQTKHIDIIERKSKKWH